MENYIITPTFSGHFIYIEKYLESFCRYVEDPETITLCFTISKKETSVFNKILEKYQIPNIRVCIFEDILRAFNIPCTSDDLLSKYGKFSFQTLKKFLTILYIQAPRALVLDSESMWVRPCNMKDMFDNYFKHPFLTVSSLQSKKWDSFTKQEIYNINYALGTKCKLWPLENFVWFYDISILNNMINEYGSLIDIIDRVWNQTRYSPWQAGVFEILLYQEYILMNLERYPYEIIHIDQKLKECLGEEEYHAYIKKVEIRYGCGGGLAEHVCEFAEDENYYALGTMLNESHQFILRCDQSMFYRLYQKEKKLLDIAAPFILAASQEHYFGINENRALIIKTGIRHKVCILRDKIRTFFWGRSPTLNAVRNIERAIWDFRIEWENYEFRHFLQETEIDTEE